MVMGYVDRPSAEPGSSLALHVRASGERWTARAVRLLALEIPSAGVERREQPVDAIAPVARESIEQLTPVGSFVRAEAGTADLAAGLTVAAVAMPTRPGAGPQAIVAGGGWALGLDDAGIPTLWLDGDVAVATSTPLVRGCWVLLAAAADPSRDEVRIAALPVGTLASNRVVEASPPDSASTPFTGAVYWEPGEPLLLGAGRLDFRSAPDEYAAMHFHGDAMTVCAWRPHAEIPIPDEAPSGVYAVRLESDGAEDLVPFIVRPAARGRDRAAAARALDQQLLGLRQRPRRRRQPAGAGVDADGPGARRLRAAALPPPRAPGSLYEWHLDGSGVCHSSWRRPILTMRPHAYNHNGPVWQFQADMQLIDWLDRTGRQVDVVCDRDVHERGAELLGRYHCVPTGSHPEYVTGPILDAYEGHVAGGGRLAYLGGNGMYWVTAYDPEDPQVIEIRRASGTQAWAALPGEHHLSFTGEPGGTWRSRRRAPQKSFGVGFVAHGNPMAAAGYRRVAAEGSWAAWVFAGTGVPDGGDFGAYGVMGGAAGIEVDAVDPELGTPESAILLATSIGHGPAMIEARENFNMTHTALGDGGDNEISRILGNVIDRFAAAGPVLD